MLRIGIVGMGTVSMVHVQGIQEIAGAELVAICDKDPNCDHKVPGFPFYEDLEAMLSQETLDVVHVCLPHYLHDWATLKIAQAGCHVLLEKPVSVDAKRSRQLMADLSDLDAKVRVAVCFQNRLNDTVVTLRRCLAEESAKVIAVKGLVSWYRPKDYYDRKPWRGTWEEAGSGSLINQAIHTLDLMRYVTDNDWKTCKAMVGNLLDYSIEVEDTGAANFEFTDGSHGFFMGTNAYYGNDSIELQVMTDKGRYTIKEDILFDEDLTPLAENERVPGTKIYYGPSHRRYFESFYEAIRTNNDEGYCHLGDALVTMEMIDAMKASSKKNAEVIKEEFIYD